MPITIESLSFDLAVVDGWFKADDGPRGVGWIDNRAAPQNILMKDFYPDSRADYGVDLADTEALRSVLRSASNGEGRGLLSADRVMIRGTPVVRVIEKCPQQPDGMAYMSSLTVIGRTAFFMIRLNCFEGPPTGLRETIVLDQCLRDGRVIGDANSGKLLGWSRDPYDGSHEYPWMPNISEQEAFDDQFPDHPLSRCRTMLQRIETSMTVDGAFAHQF